MIPGGLTNLAHGVHEDTLRWGDVGKQARRNPTHLGEYLTQPRQTLLAR